MCPGGHKSCYRGRCVILKQHFYMGNDSQDIFGYQFIIFDHILCILMMQEYFPKKVNISIYYFM